MAAGIRSVGGFFGKPAVKHCLALCAVFAVAQWFQPDTPAPVLHYERAAMWDNPALDQTVASIIKRSCIDCHSNETRWPWYARISPGSWLMTSHVRRARLQINFSEQWHFSETQRGEIADAVNSGSMPPWSYLVMHPSARLSQQDREVITDWAEGRFDRSSKPTN